MSHSHRKIHSQGNIPFSWENSPGISKHDFFLDHTRRSSIPTLSPPPNFHTLSNPLVLNHEDMKIPPPPCQNLQPPRRSISSNKATGKWHEDPFLAAYKECTKSSSIVGNCGKLDTSENKTKNVEVRKYCKFMRFSCKNSSDAEDKSFVRLCNLPPIPRGRVKGR